MEPILITKRYDLLYFSYRHEHESDTFLKTKSFVLQRSKCIFFIKERT